MLPFRDWFTWSTIYRSDDREKFLEPLPLEMDLLFSFVLVEDVEGENLKKNLNEEFAKERTRDKKRKNKRI